MSTLPERVLAGDARAIARAISLVERGLVDVSGLVTHRYPLAEVDEVFRVAAARTGLKVVVEPA